MTASRRVNGGKRPRKSRADGAPGRAVLPATRKALRLCAAHPPMAGTAAPALTEDYRKRLNLLYSVGRKVDSASELPKLLDEVMRMTSRTLHASASSVLLLDQTRRELYFEVAEGQARKTLRQVRLSLDAGIAGWVARHGKPAVSNDVTADKRFNLDIDKTTGFVTRSVLAVPMMWDRKVVGVLEVLNKIDGSGFNQQDVELLTTLASTAASLITNARLQEAVMSGYESTIKALVAAIDAKDPYTRGHSQRVMEYVLLGAGAFGMSAEETKAVQFGALLHDVGKIGIDDSILRKSDCLTSEEWLVVRRHPQIGAHIIGEVSFLSKAREVILHHHERWDGAGYPDGLRGESIPVGARLVAAADTFDTMTSDRPYRAAMGSSEALLTLVELAGSQFCPRAVAALVSVFEQNQDKLATRPRSAAFQPLAFS